jgi:magnesium chelatase family protein
MGFATARTITLAGATGHLIDVQADVSNGVVGTALVGRPDAAINEGRDRCKMAVQNSHYDWPTTRRVTILLSPADLPKSGPHFDLAMAVAVLAATGAVPISALASTAFIGELTLSGALRPTRGVLPMVMAAAARGLETVFVPEPQAAEASLVPGMTVFGMRSLRQVVAELRGEEVPEAPPVEAVSAAPLLNWRGQDRLNEVDFADVHELHDARFAVEVAAAGGHHLLLSGPKGAGKTTLAERLPGILPDLTLEESLELMAIYSLAGVLEAGTIVHRPPFSAPHSSASRASVLGGGSGQVRPGEISRSHGGVLFLDEFPMFATDIIEALRQPLESGEVTIARGDETATFPARGMVVLATNPCRCGNYTGHRAGPPCTCSPVDRRHYRSRMSAPILDRIDITRHVHPTGPIDREGSRPESSAAIRVRVEAARARQAERYAGQSWRTNGQAPGPLLEQHWPLDIDLQRALDAEVYQGKLTRRGATRVHRLAWTLADLRAAPRPSSNDLTVALGLRKGDPLAVQALRRRAG